MYVQRLWLRHVRSHTEVELELSPGVNLFEGPNGVGKTNLVESIAFIGSLRSFRGAPTEALVQAGAAAATIRAEVVEDGRVHLFESELPARGRVRVQVNRNRLQRRRDLLEVVQTTVFGPDDLELVKGGPGLRRALLDDAVVQVRPADELVVGDWERALRQRNSFLKQTGPAAARRGLDEAGAATLEVWDAKAVELGGAIHELRRRMVERLSPFVADAYDRVAGRPSEVRLRLVPGWSGGDLASALVSARPDDLRRGVSTVGPHRDELLVELDGLAARTHSSQGEQRCLALALRLGVHQFVTEARDAPPILILDDVFSELDGDRSRALVGALPAGQTFVTSAVGAPDGVRPDAVFRLDHDGGVVRAE